MEPGLSIGIQISYAQTQSEYQICNTVCRKFKLQLQRRAKRWVAEGQRSEQHRQTLSKLSVPSVQIPRQICNKSMNADVLSALTIPMKYGSYTVQTEKFYYQSLSLKFRDNNETIRKQQHKIGIKGGSSNRLFSETIFAI